MSTLYASFVDASAAERAAGALLDHGANPNDLSLISNRQGPDGRTNVTSSEAADAEHAAKTGLSTTTPQDVAAGAVKGTMVGIGVGALAALASLFIPGLGFVVGGGAVATALMGAAGTALAGTAAGSVAGLLADQGVPEDMVATYSRTFADGGAILALAVPSGDLGAADAEALLAKYDAMNVATYNIPRVLADGVEVPASVPLVVDNANPDIAPIMVVDQPPVVAQAVVQAPATPIETTTTVDVIDPVTGVVTQRNVETVQATTLEPNDEVVIDPASGLAHSTVGHPTVVSETAAVATDPDTGLPRPATIVEEQRAVRTNPVIFDEDGNPILPDSAGETVVVRDKKIELR